MHWNIDHCLSGYHTWNTGSKWSRFRLKDKWLTDSNRYIELFVLFCHLITNDISILWDYCTVFQHWLSKLYISTCACIVIYVQWLSNLIGWLSEPIGISIALFFFKWLSCGNATGFWYKCLLIQLLIKHRIWFPRLY